MKLFYFMLIFPMLVNNSFAQTKEPEPQTSIGFQTLTWVGGELRDVVMQIYIGFANIISPILYLVTAFTILGIVIGYIVNRPLRIYSMVSIFITIVMLKLIAMDVKIFENWIYTPIQEVMIGLPSYIINIVVDKKFTSLSTNPLENMFFQMDATIGAMTNFSEEVMHHNGFIRSASIWLKAQILQITFFILQVVFSYIFIMSIWSIHMLLAGVPFALCLAVHPKTRKYIFNIIRHVLVFLITPAIASIAMAVTISLLSDLTIQAHLFIEQGVYEFPANFFWHAMFLGIMSICFHLKANSFASMIVGGFDVGTGQLFGGAIATSAAVFGAVKNNIAGGVSYLKNNNSYLSNGISYSPKIMGSRIGVGGKIMVNSDNR